MPGDPVHPHDLQVNELVAECIARSEREGEQVVEAICAQHPEHAAAIQKRILVLRRLGIFQPPPGSDDDQIPERLGDFELGRRLGSGGMGVVYLARQSSLGRDVAIKLIRPEHLYFPQAKERFRREVEAAARLRHPGIVAVHVVGEECGIPFFAMEHIDGCSLAHAIAALQGERPERLTGADLARVIGAAAGVPRDQAPPPPGRGWVETCVRVIEQVALALDHAHERGVLHRDIKPSNIMLAPDGRVVLLDFGVASIEGTSKLTRTGSQPGSLPYMAPEQVRGETSSIDVRTDVYGLGVTLYELLAMRPAYRDEQSEVTRARVLEGNPPALRSLNPAVPWDVETVCLTAMEREPARRYPTAAALAADLENLLEYRPILARRPGPALRARRFVQRHPAWSVGLALGALVLLGGPILYGLQKAAAAREIRGERDRAVNAKQEADRQRERADANFQRAHRAIDRMLTRVAEERIAQIPEMVNVRRTLLADAVEFYRTLQDDHATDPDVRLDSARASSRLGNIHVALGENDQAKEAFDSAIDVLEGLLALHPDDARIRLQLSLTCMSAATLARVTGDLSSAEQSFDRARELQEALVERESENPEYRRFLARTLDDQGQLLFQQGRVTEAIEAFELARERHSELAARLPDQVDAQHELATCLNDLGYALTFTGDLARAEPHLRRALALCERIVESAPGDADYRHDFQHDLARVDHDLGLLLRKSRRESEAEACLQRAIAIQQNLVRAFPAMPAYRWDLGESHLDLGRTLECLSRAGAAEEAYQKALELQRSLVSSAPGIAAYRSELGATLGGLASLRLRADRTDEARKLIDEAIVEQKRALEHAPEEPVANLFLCEHDLLLAEIRVRSGDCPGAATLTLEAVRHEGIGREGHVAAARMLARCVRLAAADESVARECAARAVELLREAVSRGFTGLRELENDADFASLSENEEFAALIADGAQ